MGRPALKPAAPLAIVDTAAVDTAMQALEPYRLRRELVDARFGSDDPYDLTRSIERVRANMRQAGEAYLMAGMELGRIREMEDAGAFASILDELRLSARTANRMIGVALKYQGSLRGLPQTLNPSQLLELAHEPDEDLEALMDGGDIAGLKLDAIARMPVRELRERLRHDREDAIAKEHALQRLLDDKNKKLDELTAKLGRKERGPGADHWDRVTSQLSANVTVEGGQALLHLDALSQLRETILTANAADGQPIPDSALEHLATLYLDLADQVAAAAYGVLEDAEAVFAGYRDAVRDRLNQATLAAASGAFAPLDPAN